MITEDAKKWLKYHEQGIKPTRYKLESVVYSDNALETNSHIKFREYELTLAPLPLDKKNLGHVGGLFPAFVCTVTSSHTSHKPGNNFDLYECLDRVMPLIGFKYRLPLEYTQWEEYEGEWITSIGGSGSISMQSVHKVIPHPNIQEVVEAYEAISSRVDKRAKKSVAIRGRLKEALELEDISRRFSFLSYYNILEIISDDLASSKSTSISNPIAADISKFSLSTKGSQRTKLYFLLSALENDFDLDQSITLADIRNDLAHGELSVDNLKFQLCKKIAYWAAEIYILQVSQTPPQP